MRQMAIRVFVGLALLWGVAVVVLAALARPGEVTAMGFAVMLTAPLLVPTLWLLSHPLVSVPLALVVVVYVTALRRTHAAG